MERKKKSKRPATPGEDEFAFSHERTREERDAEGRANAIDVDAGEVGGRRQRQRSDRKELKKLREKPQGAEKERARSDRTPHQGLPAGSVDGKKRARSDRNPYEGLLTGSLDPGDRRDMAVYHPLMRMTEQYLADLDEERDGGDGAIELREARSSYSLPRLLYLR